ncbi:3-hydroxyacyl-CoA dehydrogenase NAD-binding domain-containing protein [Lutibaculum baratangense]|uniref:Enoyl-CoA hydratase n=1 Tax=Lutibaculum baratangense AMV1 TaxID=631454 RepID=V4REH5_9HYPH|nr:3-hydroxyacyl-CoA dehydrogenase NAD-binding domain-containing protein [Lutibaculum baratangense]ESR23789.1 Enoyl-CoA hydratase [Lutibaculum baratangense AMV1]
MDQSSGVNLAVDGDVAVLRAAGGAAPVFGADVRAALIGGLRAALLRPDVRAIVLAIPEGSAMMGADEGEIEEACKAPTLMDLQAEVEDAAKPVVAALSGSVLGAGFEFALACHGRVASKTARLGLPHAKFGMMPLGGAIQRLSRLAGIRVTLDMVLSGTAIDAAAAEEAGIVDWVVEDDLTAAASAFAHCIAEGEQASRRAGDLDVPDRDEKQDILSGAIRTHGRKLRGTRQLELTLSALRVAAETPFDEGLATETELSLELARGAEASARRHVARAERETWRIPDIPAETETLPVERVGIVGAGTMGGGIAMNFLNTGLPVTIVETRQEALDRGVSVIRRNYDGSARKGRMSQDDVEVRMRLLTGTLALEDLASCDLVIEAVFENMEVKKEIFGRLDAIVRPDAILASNTSYLDVDEIARATSRPERVLGLHFFSPANIMRLLEVVRAEKTSKPVLATTMQLARRIGKVGVMVGVCFGFVGNRMLAQRQREATKLILEGAMPWDVDRVLYDFGLPMGPFAMSDLAGLDLGWSRETSKGETVKEILCEMDRRGQKTGAGFYDYDENRKAVPSKVTETVILDLAERRGMARREIADEEILKRCIYPMINEGAKILDEGKAIRASDIDVVWINGYGWPAHRGGPMYYGDRIGLDEVLETMRRFEATQGEDFRPAPLLERLVREGRGFGDL